MNYGQTCTNNLARAEQRRVAAGAGAAMLSRLTVFSKLPVVALSVSAFGRSRLRDISDR
jgi:hypothetical protein